MERTFYFVKKEDYVNNFSDKSFVEVVDDDVISDNSYAWNHIYEALRINDASTNKKGAIEFPIGYYREGDVVKISTEIMSVTGGKPHLALSQGNTPTGNDLGAYFSALATKTNEFELIEYAITMLNDGYLRLIVGTSLADVGDFYVRNIKVVANTTTNNDSILSHTKKTTRLANILVSNGDVSLVTGYVHDKMTITKNADLSVTLTFDKPFTFLQTTPFAIQSTNMPHSHFVRTTALTALSCKLWVQNKDGQLYDLSTVNGLYIQVCIFGEDYALL